MTDIHTHILHKIDDGAPDLSAGLAIAKALTQGGVTKIAATPHYYGEHMPPDEFAKLRDERIVQLSQALENEKIRLDIVPSAEVLLDRLLLNNSSLECLCYGNKNRILLEMPKFDGDFDEYSELIWQIMSYYNVNPVIAHIERYPYFIKNIGAVRSLKDMGCMIQLDADCFLGSFAMKRFGLKLIKNGLADVIGSDCHNTGTRKPNLHEAYDYIRKKTDADTAAMLMQNAERIVSAKER